MEPLAEGERPGHHGAHAIKANWDLHFYKIIDKIGLKVFTCWEDTPMLPQDVYMLLSAVNMKLRDEYDSLEDLCADENIEREALEEKLRAAGFAYDAEHRRFA